MLQLGHAAHAFPPSSGNGGTKATEDATSLAACLDVVGGKEGVASARRVHNLPSFEHVSCLQALGVVNQVDVQGEGVGGRKEPKKPRVEMWIVEHDPEKCAYENYRLPLRDLREGTGFKKTNVPAQLVYKPWMVDRLLAAMEKGEQTVLDEG